MRIVLLSTYELGRQPFGLASPAAWLRAAGHEVHLIDAAAGPIHADQLRAAELIGLYLPMHTATRIAAVLLPRIRDINPQAKLCAFGLYAPANELLLRELGVETIIGGEFEPLLLDLANGSHSPEVRIGLDRLTFAAPDRSSLPPLTRYAHLNTSTGRKVAGYTEATRGCKHQCRHCPVVPVYRGAFRIVQPEVVLDDIRQQVAAGAQHISFGDPDFFNGPAHAQRIVESLHSEFPDLTYDATIKIEHLLKHASLLPVLRRTGCAFVTSAVESLDDHVLDALQKGHTRADFLRTVELMRSAGLIMSPTFIAFTPWTTRAAYSELLSTIAELDLVEATSPIQLALRLLIPLGSGLLDLEEIRAVTGPFDRAALAYRWNHPDPAMDTLSKAALHAVWAGQKAGRTRRQIFAELSQLADGRPPENFDLMPRAAIPYLDEPWYC